jgi:hypothetical protein
MNDASDVSRSSGRRVPHRGCANEVVTHPTLHRNHLAGGCFQKSVLPSAARVA